MALTRPKADEKRRLRAAMRARSGPEDAARARASGLAACRHLVAWSGFAGASQVVAFASLADEVDTRAIIDAAFAAGKRVLLPRISGATLEFVETRPAETLVPGRFGVSEPRSEVGARRVADGSIVLVPGLAFDRCGGRLGRGAGYYDRALAEIAGCESSTRFIGVAFPRQVVERVPMSAHDVRMHGILTEAGLTWVESAGPTREE